MNSSLSSLPAGGVAAPTGPAPLTAFGARAAYHALQTLALPLSAPLFLLHPRLRGGFAQRLGGVPRRDDQPLWLHGSSAGDVAALLPLLRRLEGPRVLSTFTRAGDELAHRRGADALAQRFRLPIDWAPLCWRVLRRLKPRALVLECLELWPALVGAAQRRGVPVFVVNGRMSERSRARYQRFDSLFRPRFAALAGVCALSAPDAERFARAGVAEARIAVIGSSKHGDLPRQLDGAPRRRLVLGSVHADELEVLDALPALLARWSDLEVEVAPRYLHDVARTRRRIARLALDEAQRRRVFVREQMGGLSEAYRGAAVAFVGGSLTERGGHNVVEPASHGAHVVVGPHTESCAAETAALARAGVLSRIARGGELARAVEPALATPSARQAEAALDAARSLAGEADKLADRLRGALEGAP